MNPTPPRVRPLSTVLFAVAIVAIAFRYWTSFCFFPLAEWNSVRLAPTFMLWFGSTPYPGLDHGPLTTWIYGPVPLLLNLPAVLAPDAIGAVLTAGIITLLCALVPAALAVFALAAPAPEMTRADRAWALLLCLALWPGTTLQYLQADNTALACGLLSNVFLARARGTHGALLALAGLGAALAIWSKQTSLGLIPAQVLWLGFAVDRRTAVRYALVSVALVVALAAVFVAWFGAGELWLNLVRIPGRLPFCESILAYTREFWVEISAGVLLPAAAAIVARRAIWRRDSPWLLPMLTWLCLLPTALISIYRIGGATNSLNGVLYLLPLATLAVAVKMRQFAPRTARAWLAASILTLVSEQLASAPVVPLLPLTTHLAEGARLAREFPGRIYFPWHPLLTFFSERRFYHAEDGLYTRHLVAIDRDRTLVKRDLPPAWSLTAIPGWRTQGVFTQLQSPAAQLRFIGKWAVYAWPPAHEPATRP